MGKTSLASISILFCKSRFSGTWTRNNSFAFAFFAIIAACNAVVWLLFISSLSLSRPPASCNKISDPMAHSGMTNDATLSGK